MPRSSQDPGWEEPELRLILVGKSGVGKSATGNTILGRKAFESVLRPRTTTLRCQKEAGRWEDLALSVIDTPALLDAGIPKEVAFREIRSCLALSSPGPHALVFVAQVGRFTAEDRAAAQRVPAVFGPEAFGRTVVLFTRKEDLAGAPLEDYVWGSENEALRGLIRKCGGRFCAFDNREGGAGRERQVSELMGIVRRMVRENGGRHYSNELYLQLRLTDGKIQAFLARNGGGGRDAWRAKVKAVGGWVWKKKWWIGGVVAFAVVAGFIIYLVNSHRVSSLQNKSLVPPES